MKFIQNLQAALYVLRMEIGVCRETGKLIPKERLRAVPHATLSIEAKSSKKIIYLMGNSSVFLKVEKSIAAVAVVFTVLLLDQLSKIWIKTI